LTSPQGPALQIASPLAFDHAVVQARLDGRDYYLDATRLGQGGALDRMGQGLEDASVLVVDAHDVTGLATVRSPNRGELFRNELTERFRIPTFGEDGELEVDERLTGLGAESMRMTGARLDTAGLRRTLLTNLERRYAGITLIGNPELQDDADQNRMALHAKFKVPKLAVSVDNRWVMRFVPANLQGAIGVPQAPKRTFPLMLPGFPTTFTYVAEVQWPKNVSIVSADTLQLANPAFKAEVGRSFHGNVSRVALRFEPLTPSVSSQDYAEFIADAQKLLRTTGNTMSVGKDQVKGDGFLGIGKKTMQDSLRIAQEASVERTGKVIAGGQLGSDDLAQTYCTRAEANRQLGNAAEALQDAHEAVRIAPSFALAWSCMGDIDGARGEFAMASSDFSKALTLGESPPLVYYRRGQTRFFEGKLEAAEDDFAKAAAARADPADKAHAMLWRAWTLLRLGRPLAPEIVAFAASDSKGAWPQPALALFSGELTPEQLLQQIDSKTGDDRELALTEGWFYIGEYQLVQSNNAKAREAFEKARAQGIARYVEYDAADLELQRLGAKP
jgi:lipoprotein NlpI